MNLTDPPETDPEQSKDKQQKWPLKTLIEILPIIIALTVFFSYTTIKNVSDVALVTPLSEVLAGIPLWIVGLMGLILLVGLCGMGWLIYIFTRAPIKPDSSSQE